MSGDKDPNGTTLPQQVLHEALLPGATQFEGFKRVTNPTWFDIDGTSFLGTSGQNIDDIFKYLESEDRLSMACSTLEWSHMAPTAPDTLCEPRPPLRYHHSHANDPFPSVCYPFQDRDPFILTRTPNVYFIGNQPSFGTRLITTERDPDIRARVILIPRFSQTGQIVLLNTRTLSCKVVSLSC
jgi:DNA polymerase delta subunit 2